MLSKALATNSNLTRSAGACSEALRDPVVLTLQLQESMALTCQKFHFGVMVQVECVLQQHWGRGTVRSLHGHEHHQPLPCQGHHLGQPDRRAHLHGQQIGRGCGLIHDFTVLLRLFINCFGQSDCCLKTLTWHRIKWMGPAIWHRRTS